MKLPLEFQSGNGIPVTRAAISRERMIEILEEAKRIPHLTEDEVNALADGSAFALSGKAYILKFIRQVENAVLSKL